jgi:2-amino-4-hydroxy-6-hydroxymethyldihydropteridine diphosphokinase
VIDVDVLLFGEQRRAGPGLVLPHPRLHERRFVLAPSPRSPPTLVHPGLGLTVRELLARCPDASAVSRHVPPGSGD